jgi:hypothetical protein
LSFKKIIESLQNADSLEDLIGVAREYFTYQQDTDENRNS